MRSSILLLACCWWAASFSPLPGSGSPAGPGAPGTIFAVGSPESLNLSGSSAEMPGRAPRAVTIRHVLLAAREAGIPPEALFATWVQESGAASTAILGDEGRSFGPFQIQRVAAYRHCKSLRKWNDGPEHARCAARILGDFFDTTGRWTMAFTYYQWPKHRRDKPSAYGIEVYHRMLRLQLQAKRMKPMLARNGK